MTSFIVDLDSVHYITRSRIIKDNPVLSTATGWEKGEQKSKIEGKERREKREIRDWGEEIGSGRHWLLPRWDMRSAACSTRL
jgi:hypothetical protein